jgi:excisionase family DNA binding protein
VPTPDEQTHFVAGWIAGYTAAGGDPTRLDDIAHQATGAADRPTLPEVMPLTDAATRLGVSTKTLRRAIDAGDLVASEVARGRWVVRRDELLAWVDARATSRVARIQPTAPAPAARPLRRGAQPGGLREHLDRRNNSG